MSKKRRLSIDIYKKLFELYEEAYTFPRRLTLVLRWNNQKVLADDRRGEFQNFGKNGVFLLACHT